MKKLLPFLLVFLVLIIAFAACLGIYNKIVSYDEAVEAQWAQVENQYQRRFDLIPNLVSTVQAYAEHESKLFEQIARFRADSLGADKVKVENLSDEEAFKKYQECQDSVTTGIKNIIAVSESYPELKASENFLALQSELEGCENRIAVERKRFNDASKKYNTYIRRFPNSIFAKKMGLEKKSYFSSSNQASEPVQVQ